MKYRRQAVIAAAIIVLAGAACIGGYTYDANEKAEEPKPEESLEETKIPAEELKESAPVLAASEPKKEETVYVKADAKGTATEIVVSDILRNGAKAETLTDYSDLKRIKNVKGKEDYKKGENGELIWQAGGNDIYYQGTSDKTLPVELRITYYLDGEEMEPKKLAGKAGNVKIRFDYINHETRTVNVDGEERTISVPFAVATGVILDEEKFTNVEMEHGRVISDGSRIMAGGLAAPGLSDSIALSEAEDLDDLDIPEYLELTAYTTGFELPMTMTAITSDFSEEIDLDDLDAYEDLKDDMQELKDASVELVDGTHELVDGVIELQDGSIELYDGSVELDDGAKELKDGAVELDDGAYDLRDGALELKDALKAYNEGMNTLVASMANTDGNGTDIATAARQLAAGVEQTVDTVLDSMCAQMNAAAKQQFGKEIFSGRDNMVETVLALKEDDPLYAAFGGYQSQITQLLTLKESMNQFAAGVAQIYGAASTQLAPASAQILEGARKLYEGTKDLKDGTEELLDGTTELKDGTAELLDGTVELKDGVQELYDGSIELRDGMEEFDEDGIQKLYDMVCKDLQKFIDRARAVADAGEAYQTFTRLAPGMKGSVKFLIETEAVE